MRGWRSKAIWNFSKKSSDLVAGSFPYREDINRKITLFLTLPESPNSPLPPHDPKSGNLVLFFRHLIKDLKISLGLILQKNHFWYLMRCSDQYYLVYRACPNAPFSEISTIQVPISSRVTAPHRAVGEKIPIHSSVLFPYLRWGRLTKREGLRLLDVRSGVSYENKHKTSSKFQKLAFYWPKMHSPNKG